MIMVPINVHCVGLSRLQEVLRERSTWVVYRLMAGTIPVVLRGGLEDVEVHHFPWAHLQNAGRVSTSVTVIWGRPHSRQMAIKQGRVAFHAELMSAEDMRHPVRFEEFVDHSRSEGIPRASRGNCEILLLGVGVRPNQISDRAFMGYFSKPVHDFDLVD